MADLPPNVTLAQLSYFVAVAEELNFTRAAERLHVSQSPLSQAIKALETNLGVTLLERTSRHVELTPAGEELLPAARAALARGRACGQRRACRGRGRRSACASASSPTEPAM